MSERRRSLHAAIDWIETARQTTTRDELLEALQKATEAILFADEPRHRAR